jgi:hypothetical protein
VLEIGEHSLFARVWPERTLCLFTGDSPEDIAHAPHEPFVPRHVPTVLRALAGGDFDLVACYPPPDPPWAPRSAARLAWRQGWRAGPLFLRQLAPLLLARPAAIPVVVLDLGDHPVVMRHHVRLLDRCRLYFKRELPTDLWRAFLRTTGRRLPTPRQRQSPRMRARVAKLRPLSLGLAPERLAAIAACGPADKTVDVFFAGRVEGSSAVRAEGLAQLEGLRRRGYRIDLPAARLPAPEFYARCARAWLAWSPEGYGWDCFRHYEAPLAGAVPVMNYPTIRRHAPLEDRVHAFYYGVEGAGLAQVIVDALGDKPRLVRMAEAGRAHVQHHHTMERLCAHVVATCLDPGSPAAPPEAATITGDPRDGSRGG